MPFPNIQAIRFIFYLLLGTGLYSCSPDINYHQPDTPATRKVVLSAEACQDGNTLATLKQQLTDRLSKEKVFYQNINVDASTQQLTVDLIGFADEKKDPSKLNTLFYQGDELKIIPSITAERKRVKQMMEEAFVRDSTIDTRLVLNTQSVMFPSGVIGECSKTDFPFLKKSLQALENKYALKTVWERREDKDNEEVYFLYAYDQKARTVVSQDQLTKTEVTTNEMGMVEIILYFNAQGAKNFAKMTTAAAQNGNQPILVIVGETVQSAPRVMSPIMGGVASISGNYEIEEAYTIARQLTEPSLVCKINILEEQVLNQ